MASKINLYYKSNNAREDAYTKMRREEEKIANAQQDKLDLKHIENLEEMAQAKRYSKLFKNTMGEIINSTFGETKNIQQLATKIVSSANTSLADIIKAGKLDEFVKTITAFTKDELKKMGLSKQAQLVIEDLTKPELKSIVNEELLTGVKRGDTPEQLAKTATALLGGEGKEGEDVVKEIIDNLIDTAEKKGKKKLVNKKHYEKRQMLEALGKQSLASVADEASVAVESGKKKKAGRA